MRVLPGYGRRRVEHVEDPESDHRFRMCPAGGDAPQLLPVKAGGVVAFCFNVPHGTARNDTDCGRAGVAYRFARSGVVGGWRQDSNPHAEFPLYGTEGKEHDPVLSGPAYSRGVQEYDREMEQVLRDEVARLASQGTARAAAH